MDDKFNFRPRAMLILQLGDQLIRNDSIAMLELVKNSYDADATEVTIEMKEVDDVSKGVIIIEDNGTGMDINTVENVWMEPGNDIKRKMFEKGEKTKKYNRLPLGEKGIGRFGVHKLGNKVEIITKKLDEEEITIKVDWNDFNSSKFLDKIPVEVSSGKSEYFKDKKTGTRITIKGLRRPWTERTLRETYESINSLISPFDSPDDFNIKFKSDKEEWLKGLLKPEEITSAALFTFNIEMEGDKIKKFTYEFKPTKFMKKLQARTITQNDKYLSKNLRMVKDKNVPIDMSKYSIGSIRFEGYIFDRDPKILSLGLQENKKNIKSFLDKNGGVRVYRDGIRVYDYGEPGNDWLNLDIRRVNIPTVRLSNNIIVAAVHLDRETSKDLIEKANREGFIENAAYETLVDAVIYALERVEGLRNMDKDKLRKIYGSTSKSQPVIAGINNIRDVVKNRVSDKSTKREILSLLDGVEDDFEKISDILVKSAEAGITLGVVVHEIEKIVAELSKFVSDPKHIERSKVLIKHLAELIEGYSYILRKSKIRECQISEIIQQALFDVEFRLKLHKISILKPEIGTWGKIRINVQENLVIGAFINIIDNSIWWLEYAKPAEKKIYIGVVEDDEKTSIVIADNGLGFTLPTEELCKPFVTSKPNGMGLGLHIVKTVMEGNNGTVTFPSGEDAGVPKEFYNGAIISLNFNKEVDKNGIK